MTQVSNEEALVIRLQGAPEERRQWLILAIAAAIRWRAHGDAGAYESDGEHLYTLAQLLEELAESE